MAEVCHEAKTLADKSCTVLVVTFLPPAELAAFREQHGWPFRVLGDVARTVYRAYGLKRGSWGQVFHPSGLIAYWQAWRHHIPIRRPRSGDDWFQLGGDFLIDPAGEIRLAHYSQNPADRPTVSQLLQHLP